MAVSHGGDVIAAALVKQGVRFVFTLCGGHISPILVGAKQRGIRVIDVRHEATAVFAADAVARLSGIPGVAVVTAGPGVTNTITAVKNAQLAQSPLVVLGGATATMLKGRGALQDIDQMALFRPHVKETVSATQIRDFGPLLSEAFRVAQEGVPGPVFVECPVDLLYPESIVREWYASATPHRDVTALSDRFRRAYLRRHVDRLFANADQSGSMEPEEPFIAPVTVGDVQRAATRLALAERPVLLIGSQAMLHPRHVTELAVAVAGLGLPVFVSGMARGLLGREHLLLMRHRRKEALREADLVLLAGVACDFRLDYGRHINRDAVLLSVNRSRRDLTKNRRPTLPMLGDPAEFLLRLSASALDSVANHEAWVERLRARDRERDAEIARFAAAQEGPMNPVTFCRALDAAIGEHSVLVMDGGDFAATASYTVLPHRPLSFLDPGPFGTLGVGAGFALGARLSRPNSDVWILYGDGSVAFSLAEFDTFVRHEVPVIAVVGNDAAWTQIARGQREVLGDDVATTLRHSAYHVVAEGFGGKGLLVDRIDDVGQTLVEAKRIAGNGTPVLVNALIGKSEFRAGSLAI